jgi:fructoselysine transporter
MASGAIGFSRYLHFIFPGIPEAWEAPVASLLCVAVTLLLLRRIGAIGAFSVVLWIGVLATLGAVIGLGLPHLKLEVFRFWEAPVVAAAGVPPPAGWMGGLGAALILAVYDYLGYYNICYLAEEIIEPSRTIPRVIVISILSVAVLYILMNVCIVSVLPMGTAMKPTPVSDFVAALAGTRVARVVTVLILWTAFASVFSLTLGYSRILYAAARDGNFFRAFSRLHPTEGYPVVALLALGGAAAVFSFVPLRNVIMAILSIRAIIPFMAQIAGALILRRKLPASARPFRMWLYPVPALIALLLWGFVLVSPEKGFRAAGLLVLGAGTLVFLVRSRLRGEWPWKSASAG